MLIVEFQYIIGNVANNRLSFQVVKCPSTNMKVIVASLKKLLLSQVQNDINISDKQSFSRHGHRLDFFFFFQPQRCRWCCER